MSTLIDRGAIDPTTFDLDAIEVRDHKMVWGVYYQRSLVALVQSGTGETSPGPGREPGDLDGLLECVHMAAVDLGAPAPSEGVEDREVAPWANRLAAAFVQGTLASGSPRYALLMALDEIGVRPNFQRLHLGDKVHPLITSEHTIALHAGHLSTREATKAPDSPSFLKAARGTAAGRFTLTVDLTSAPGVFVARDDRGYPVAYRDVYRILGRGHFNALRIALMELAAARSDAWAIWWEARSSAD